MKKIISKSITCIILVTISVLGACSEKTSIDLSGLIINTPEKLDSILSVAATNSKIPGFSVGIVKEGKIIYTNAFGVKNLETNNSVTTKTLFLTGSISKTFVSCAIMQLEEQGKINLDSSIVNYLPYFKIKDDRYKKITIRQMLSHSSGLPQKRYNPWKDPQLSDDAMEKYVRSLYKVKLKFSPGEKYLYSNMAYVVLGDVIAQVSGISFESYINKNILTPLGMKKSTFLLQEVDTSLLASPHMRKLLFFGKPSVFKHFPYSRHYAPESCFMSNVEEMCIWEIACMNNGIYNKNRILEEKSQQEIWNYQVETDENSNDFTGLSWFLSKRDEQKIVSYVGDNPGFRATLVMFPEKNTGLVILCNTFLESSDDIYKILRKAMNELDHEHTNQL